MGLLRSVVYFIVLILLTLFFGSIWLGTKSYQFRVSSVDEIGRQWSKSFKNGYFPHMGKRNEFDMEQSPVLSMEDFEPLALSTGGLLGTVHLMYVSVSEFLLVYHAPFETSGDTGRHFMNMSITVLKGRVDVWDERNGRMIVHAEGKTYRHRIGERGLVRLPENTYLLVYGRGLVPLTMGYWISDSLFSSLDPASAIMTIVYYFKALYTILDINGFFYWLYDYSWNLAANGISAIPVMIESILGWISEKAGNIFQSGGSIMSD